MSDNHGGPLGGVGPFTPENRGEAREVIARFRGEVAAQVERAEDGEGLSAPLRHPRAREGALVKPLALVDGVRGGRIQLEAGEGVTLAGASPLVVFAMPMHGGVSVTLDAQGACEIVRALSEWLSLQRSEAGL